MNCYHFKKFLCLALTITLVFSIFATYVHANNSEIAFTVKCDADNTNYTLNLIKVDDKWYVKAKDLASLAKADAKQETNGISFYKKAPYVFLWKVSANDCKEYNASYYVPLQSTSSNIGVRFYLHGKTPKVEVLKTPQQLYAEINTIFKDESLHLINITSTAYYAVEESAARIWSALPFVGSGSIIGSLTGKEEYDRYLDIMTIMLNDSGSISEFLSTAADFNGNITKYADILGKGAQLTKKGGALYNYLKSKGVSDAVITALSYEYNPYEQDLGDFLEGYASVAKIIDMGYILDLLSYYAAIVDMDESTALCMKKVFGNSDNKYAKKATESAMNLKFGDGYIAISDIYGGIVGNLILNSIDDALDKKLTGDNDIIDIGTTILDSFFHLSDKATATIYMSICAYLQNDIIKCLPNYQSFSPYDMRAITLMHLRLALVACDCLEFDKKLEPYVESQKAKIKAYIDRIFDYAETEYDPNYDNSIIIDYLNNDFSNLGGGTDEDATTNETVVASGKCGTNLTWKLDSTGTITISGNGKMNDYEFENPPPWAEYEADITTCIIENDVTSVGSQAFINCHNLKYLTLPDSIITIGREAFCGCESLLAINLPDGVQRIDKEAFAHSWSLEKVHIPKSVTFLAYTTFLASCRMFEYISYAGTKDEWIKITGGYDWVADTPGYIEVRCTDGIYYQYYWDDENHF